MAQLFNQPIEPAAQAPDFRTTQWTQVLEAGHDDSARSAAALQRLCSTYWFPIYAYVRKQGHSPHDAEDLTQEFFARLLRLKSLETVSPEKGKFRTFLLVSLKHFLADAWDAAKATKRGGGCTIVSLDEESAEERYQLEAASEAPPDVAFDRRWVVSMLEHALATMHKEYEAGGRIEHFNHMKEFLQNAAGDGDYDRIGAALAMSSGSVAVAVHRFRQRYRDLVRAEIANTVSSSEEMEEELRHLFGR